MTDAGKIALADMVAGLDAVTKVAPGPWTVDSEKQDDVSPKHHEYALINGRGFRMLGTENCDYRFGEIHSDGPDEDGFFFDWNEPSRVLTWFLTRCSPDRIRAIAAYVAALEARATAAEAKAAEMEEAKNAILQVIKHHSGSDHGVMGVRLLVERAVAAEERVKEATDQLHKLTVVYRGMQTGDGEPCPDLKEARAIVRRNRAAIRAALAGDKQ